MNIRAERGFDVEGAFLEKLVREAAALRHRYEADACIWQALTNLGVKNQGERTRLFRVVKGTMAVQEKVRSQQQKDMAEATARMKREDLMRDAARHQFMQPPDTYQADTEYREDEI